MQIEGKSDEKTDKKITRHFKKNYKSWISFSISTIVVDMQKENRNPDQSSIYPVLINQQN